jgi:hypothetical protein
MIAPKMRRMEGVRFRKPLWTVIRYADGRIDDATDVGSFWEEARARDEASRLTQANGDSTVSYEVVEGEASGVYPADENPPWMPDPERLIRRGYEKSE